MMEPNRWSGPHRIITRALFFAPASASLDPSLSTGTEVDQRAKRRAQRFTPMRGALPEIVSTQPRSYVMRV